ncbi:MAG: hypothetical protein IKF90_25630 [Parasporobacterium sp.]|nr:hypothetical protein [Parasporobacterium sp.]
MEYYPDFQLILQGIFVILLVTFILSAVFSVVMYVFRAIGLYSISKRRYLGTSAFGWIPVLNMFKFGQIADDAVLNKSGKKTHFMILYPVFSIAGSIVASVGTFIGSLSYYIPSIDLEAIFKNPELIYNYAPKLISKGSLIVGIILLILGVLLKIAADIMLYICCFHIFKSLSTSYIVMFILSFLFSFLISIFLFAIRKKDNLAWYVPGRNQNHTDPFRISDP